MRGEQEATITLFKLYSFIFQSGNLFDLCDWFPFFCEYSISLDSNTETILIEKAKKYKQLNKALQTDIPDEIYEELIKIID